MVITIVGGGATSLAFLYNFIAAVPPGAPDTTVYLVEKRGAFGPGVAYAPDVASNILNTKTGFITPFHDCPGDFLDWLRQNDATWRRHFPAFDPHPESYAPRPLFGMYLQARMARTVKRALAANVRIIQVDAEICDVAPVGNRCVARTDCSLTLSSDYVFLCCGTLPAKPAAFAGAAGRILASPYPIAELPHKIPAEARVGIVGARLSCIDAVIGLIESGHRGPIAIHSRSGYFPCVRGTQGRIVPKFLEQGHLQALVRSKENAKLKLEDVVRLVRQEIAHASGGAALPDLALPPAPQDDLATHLAREIELARGPRIWQAVLYSTNAVIDQLWAALEEGEKVRFLAEFFSAFMSYRVSIPTQNAARLLGYLQSGQLQFHAGDFRIGADEAGKPAVRMAAGAAPLAYDYLINATGSPRATAQLDSTLLANLLQRGLAVADPLGGIKVDPRTYRLLGTGAAMPRVHALGELTTGTFFFTSALDINARHARNCATAFAAAVFGDATATATAAQPRVLRR